MSTFTEAYNKTHAHKRGVFVLQSTRNGRYLNKLFEDTHDQSFNSYSLDDCYTWKTLAQANKEGLNHEDYIIVAI